MFDTITMFITIVNDQLLQDLSYISYPIASLINSYLSIR